MSLRFPTTDWSLIMTAGSTQNDSSVWERFYRDYHPPLTGFIDSWLKGGGWRESDAEDLSHEFFTYIFENGRLNSADRERGRLRSFLISSLKNFLINQYNKDQTQKRGGDYHIVSLEENQTVVGDSELTPDELFDRRWASRILDLALRDLEDEYIAADDGELFSLLKPQLGERGQSEVYKSLAIKLDVSVPTIGNEVFKLRRRYQECIMNRLSHTVLDKEALDDELLYLKSLLSKEVDPGF